MRAERKRPPQPQKAIKEKLDNLLAMESTRANRTASKLQATAIKPPVKGPLTIALVDKMKTPLKSGFRRIGEIILGALMNTINCYKPLSHY